MNEIARKRVIRGIEFLDENFPNWFNKIDLSNFDIKNKCKCILYYVHPSKDYWSAINNLSSKDDFNEDFVEFSSSLGFTVLTYDGLITFTDLQEIWVEVIKQRQGIKVR